MSFSNISPHTRTLEYQREVYKLFERYRPEANYPVYPPYHQGLYLEEYFCKTFQDLEEDPRQILIPVHWTNCYKLTNDRGVPGLQLALDSLSPDYKYFVVCTHDDAPREKLPPGTKCYAAGGNAGGTPIPLICSSIPPVDNSSEKDIFASFVGSITHNIRGALYDVLAINKEYFIDVKRWTPSISTLAQNNFLDIMKRSDFSLCPRGYGSTSYRLYESMQLDSIPVYISDEFWLPWEDEIDWHSFCIFINPHRLHEIDPILSSISDEEKKEMRKAMKLAYNKYFTLERVASRIMEDVTK